VEEQTRRSPRRLTLSYLVLMLGILAACSQMGPTSPDAAAVATHGVTPAKADAGPTRIGAVVQSINDRLVAGGSDMRLDDVWMFSLGNGIPEFRRLRTGGRWGSPVFSYGLDLAAGDYPDGVPTGDVLQALTDAYDTWNGVANAGITAQYAGMTMLNFDILDGMVLDTDGACVDIVDTTAANLVDYDPTTGALTFFPAADVLVGGWLTPQYFEDCLGSADIIAVTFTFSLPDQNGDHYRDIAYVEQYFNKEFDYTTMDAEYLNFSAPFDIQTLALHEDGHTFGLDHFGGPNPNQPFKLKPNGKVYSPHAVMNPFYLGGEQRTLLPTDIAGLRTLYAQNH